MTVERYDLLSPKEIEGGTTIFRKVGVAFARKGGQEGFSIELEMIPFPDKEGRVRLMMLPPKPREERAPPTQREAAAGSGGSTNPYNRPTTSGGNGGGRW